MSNDSPLFTTVVPCFDYSESFLFTLLDDEVLCARLLSMNEKITIEDLGYGQFFESGRMQLGLDNFQVARVISEFKGAYKVKNANGEFLAKITGKQIFNASSREDYPAIGDWVAITEIDNENAVIQGILPRMTMIKRKGGDKNRSGGKDKTQIIATNIDVAFVVESINRDYNLNRFERYFSILEDGEVKPAIILSKIDLTSEEELEEKLTELKNRFPGIDIFAASALNNVGIDKLKKYIAKGKTYCFLGSSGAGKSSLINSLLGEDRIKTGDIGSHSDRGRHVTTTRETYFLENGGIVIDNPGMREVGIADSSRGLETFFDEISALSQKCKYADCTHTHEPGCEVLAAVESKKLDKEKYSNYINLKKETAYYGMSDVEKKEKNRQTGKFFKNAKKDLKKFRHKDF